MRRFYEQFQINQTVSDLFVRWRINQTVSDLSDGPTIQKVSERFGDRLLIDFRKHLTLGWSHYRLLLGQHDLKKRAFYFEHSASQRWSVRELQRRIEGALFERVALSRHTRKLVTMEKQVSVEPVRYEDVFKDPYILDFLGLKAPTPRRTSKLRSSET
jgi:hypothetical protein